MNPTSTATDIAITEAEFERFRDWFYRKTGIFFEPGKRYFVDTRLADCIQASGNPDFRSWFVALRGDPHGTELQRVVNAMTINETYFFREAYQFDCMVNHLLDEVVKHKRSGPIRIWSVPSSTGEEPYSIAIYLLERWAGIQRHDVEILSSDIDTQVLATAQQGLYSQRSVANLPAPYLKKYFQREGEHQWRISREIVDAVEFSQVNLVDLAQARRFRNIDIIFCRNVLIYFDDLSRRLAAEAMYDAVAPGGFVCLGHSESMSRISTLFEARRFPDALVYQKPKGAP